MSVDSDMKSQLICTVVIQHGKYRKLMRREFDYSLYHERNKTETIFSVIKRRFDSKIRSYNEYHKNKRVVVSSFGLQLS